MHATSTVPGDARSRLLAPALLVALALLVGRGWLGAGELFVDQHAAKADDKNPGTAEQPLRTISAGALLAQPGDTVWIASGIYREEVTCTRSGTATSPISFAAAPGATVIVSGADRMRDWRKEEGAGRIFSTPWPHAFMTHPDDAFHRLIGRCEQVMVAGYGLRQVLERGQLARGAFWVDLAGKRLWAWSASDDNLADENALVEAAVRSVTWHLKGDYLQLRGLRFRYAANHAQQGALEATGRGGVVEDCVFERTNAAGACFSGAGIAVRRCIFQDNGQLGFGASFADGLHLAGCTIRHNNCKGFDRGWEAGGDKICLSRGVLIEGCQFTENRGTGLWFDIANDGCEVRNCLIADNEDAGIFFEISFALNAHDNVIIGNGLNDSAGAWGASSGIALSSSPGCTIERNLIMGNKEGFNFREQGRTTPRLGAPKGTPEEAVWNHDQLIRSNIIAYNRDAQTWGWFDIDDGRHWPAAMQEHRPDAGAATVDVAKAYKSDATKVPPGLSLETLKIAFSGNFYAIAPGQQLFCWGTAWKKNRRYASLDEVRNELKLEQGSETGVLSVADFPGRDLSVAKDSAVLRLGCYPRGAVPGVVLGTR